MEGATVVSCKDTTFSWRVNCNNDFTVLGERCSIESIESSNIFRRAYTRLQSAIITTMLSLGASERSQQWQKNIANPG
jgi:hypothetical protein